MARKDLKLQIVGGNKSVAPNEQEIRKRKWGWIGHTLCKNLENVTKPALHWSGTHKEREEWV